MGGAALREKLAGTVKFDLSFRGGRPLVAMHPFSGRLIKNWPIENFMRLASWLTGDMGVAVVLLGTKGDAESLPNLAEMAKSANANSLVGETSLQEAIAIISQADLYIGNDSGLTHVAARLDIPSLAIFSGVAPIENWAPFGKDVTIIHAPVECAPCSLPSLDYCPNGHKCIGAIDFEYVQSEVLRRLEPCLNPQ
jgi:ADP-heptose:LPS heptosyltransferase